MTEPKRVGDLEVFEDMPFQEREWKVQRVGWALMLVFIVLALLGLFSTGPLSSASEEAGDGALTVDYQRFVRHDGRSTLSIEVDGSLARNGEIELWVSKGYFGAVETQNISPQPDEIRDTGNRRIMVFLVDDAASTLEVDLTFRPQDMWRISGEAGVVDGPSLSFDQLSYP